MSRILALCDQGNNRSVTVAQLVRYIDGGHDVLSAGLSRNDPGTLAMLFEWADRIITTDATQHVPDEYAAKVLLWNIGPDRFKRPFNPELRAIVLGFIAQHRDALAA